MVRILKFDSRKKKSAYRVITHIHTVASDGKASPLYSTVAFGIKQVLGEDKVNSVHWRECLIEPSDIDALLLGSGRAKADLVCITDHMSLRSHKFSTANIGLARRWSNLILGAEISTVAFVRNRWRRAPEILLYGPPQLRVDTETGEVHYGLTQSDIDELYSTCVPKGAPEAEVNAVIEFAEKRGFAWALAHPLDANELTAEEILPLIAKSRAVEVLNGGFSDKSYEILASIVNFHNWFVANKPQIFSGTILMLNDIQHSFVNLLYNKAQPILSLGGSDAHVRNLDRVITLFSPPKEFSSLPIAEAFLASLCNPEVALNSFVPQGKGASTTQTFAEAMQVILTVIKENIELFGGVRLGKAIAVGAGLASERIASYFLRQRLLVKRMQSLDVYGLKAKIEKDLLPNQKHQNWLWRLVQKKRQY